MYALGTTALGLGAVLVAAEENNAALGWTGILVSLIGPSAGHIYAGESGHAVKASLLRTGGFVTFVAGAISASSVADCIDYCEGSGDGEGLMLLGGAVVVGATLYDFWDAARAARRTNEKQQRAYLVGPTMMSQTAGGLAPGLALSGSF